MELKCTPEAEARVFRDTYKVSIEAFEHLGNLNCPVMIAVGTEPVAAAIEAEAPLIAAQIPRGRFEKCVPHPALSQSFPFYHQLLHENCGAIPRPWADDRRHCQCHQGSEACRGYPCACRYAGVGHLGPFEAPAQVAERALLCFKLAKSQQHWHSLPKGQQLAFQLPKSRL